MKLRARKGAEFLFFNKYQLFGLRSPNYYLYYYN